MKMRRKIGCRDLHARVADSWTALPPLPPAFAHPLPKPHPMSLPGDLACVRSYN